MLTGPGIPTILSPIAVMHRGLAEYEGQTSSSIPDVRFAQFDAINLRCPIEDETRYIMIANDRGPVPGSGGSETWRYRKGRF